LIIDASAALSQVLPSQKTTSADEFFADAAGPFSAPDIFVWEFINTLLRAERIGVITPKASDSAISDWLGVIEISAASVALALTALSRSQGLSLFDSAYLELAERLGAPLVSRDFALLEAARRRGVPVHDLR